MPQVDTNGIKIEYRFDGKEGAPYITFVTGIANDLTMWDTQVEALGKDYRTLRYDLRGHGDTLATEGDYSMELLARDLGGLLNELNIQKTHLVGLGLGGAIVQRFAIEHPQRVNALVPCCCRAKMTPEFAAMWQSSARRWRTKASKSSSSRPRSAGSPTSSRPRTRRCCRTCAT